MELITTEKQLLRLSKDILIASGADRKEVEIVSQILVWCTLSAGITKVSYACLF